MTVTASSPTFPVAPPTDLGQFLWHFILRQKTAFFLLMFFHCAWAVDQTILPFAFKMLTERMIAYKGDFSDVLSYIGFPLFLGASIWLYSECCYRCFDYLQAITFPKFQAHMRLVMVQYVQGHSYSYFADHFAGSLANKINDLPQSATRILQTMLIIFIPASLALMIALIIFCLLHPLFAAILFVWVSLHIGIAILNARKANHLSRIHSESRSVLIGKIVDSLVNHINVRIFARQKHELDIIDQYQTDEQHKYKAAMMVLFKIRLLQGVTCFVMIGVGLMSVLIYCWSHQIISVSDVVYIFYTSWGITVMAWYAGSELPSFYNDLGTCKQALSIMKAQHSVIDLADAQPLVVTKGKIVFDNVTFHYRRNNNLFNNKTVTLEAGQKVGLVGFSGSGKTTFVNLIMRFFDIDGGRILIDDQDIKHMTLESIRQNIALIPQSPSLFHRSIMDNIRYGKLDASDQDVIDAAKRAHCHEFVSDMEDGYDTLVGERGMKCSEGQRQRIAIARAFLKNAPILILDEATSALDSMTEHYIQDSLKELMDKRTTLVIAHRLSTLADMDRILVFKEGQIIEDGSHMQLISQHGHYALMWHMQAGGFLPDDHLLKQAG
ncbi:MAG: ABC transporter ATP-binding protein [Alphaproteobacteria bacterium]|nr:ABC transporter ATP-binding protein [Alphaproteobacteria bacterium]